MLEKFANTKNDFKSEGVSRKKYLSVFSKSVDQLGYASSLKKIYLPGEIQKLHG